jgi:hypothetical protein
MLPILDSEGVTVFQERWFIDCDIVRALDSSDIRLSSVTFPHLLWMMSS